MVKSPKINDPVVVRGEKYRIDHFTPGWAQLKQRIGGRTATAAVERLVFDKEAGVWRVR